MTERTNIAINNDLHHRLKLAALMGKKKLKYFVEEKLEKSLQSQEN